MTAAYQLYLPIYPDIQHKHVQKRDSLSFKVYDYGY